MLGLVAAPVAADTVAGVGKVIDDDSLEVAGRRVRLFGIDAPEATQRCERSGVAWACGEASAERLRALIGSGEITCEGSSVDVYGRLLAVCRINGVDLNRMMVAGGWATAFRRYSEDYMADETRARAAKLGLWSSSFMAPEDYRRAQNEARFPRQRQQTVPTIASQTSPVCMIKGNRSRRGDWICHLPGMPYYEQTEAEEMFCSEADAVAAGYRKSRVGN